jgi:hypothetical protein
VVNKCIADNTVVSNAKVSLHWSSFDPAGEELHYKLHFGPSTDALSIVYEGNSSVFEVTGLDYKQNYYWQVEATNRYGISSRSPLFSFSTVSFIAKPFNYPNPFNPSTGQTTNIVFSMPAAGRAEITILTELGDICWHQAFENLLTGVNEVSYNGKDDRGNTLYNGTYVCLIKKQYENREGRDQCRLLVIK